MTENTYFLFTLHEGYGLAGLNLTHVSSHPTTQTKEWPLSGTRCFHGGVGSERDQAKQRKHI